MQDMNAMRRGEAIYLSFPPEFVEEFRIEKKKDIHILNHNSKIKSV
jgi:hypothetical protein